jgi:hypothetical protein
MKLSMFSVVLEGGDTAPIALADEFARARGTPASVVCQKCTSLNITNYQPKNLGRESA